MAKKKTEVFSTYVEMILLYELRPFKKWKVFSTYVEMILNLL